MAPFDFNLLRSSVMIPLEFFHECNDGLTKAYFECFSFRHSVSLESGVGCACQQGVRLALSESGFWAVLHTVSESCKTKLEFGSLHWLLGPQ
jgi:hypothetical protein